MSIDTMAMPPELLATPQPLIGFVGLDVNSNSIHRAVWEAFSANCTSNQYQNQNRKIDARANIQYKLLPYNCNFPVPKPKRTSYEWYQPRGILKRNWMLKHLHVLPAVIVVFENFEWDDPNWLERQKHCATLIQSVRTALQKRDTRICLVLLQKKPPMPPGEDPTGSERASSLVVTCGINSQMLFILPYSEAISTYVVQLESAFLSILQSYYDVLSARINNHVAQLTSAHTTLKVRLHFKLAFLAELQHNLTTACKNYQQAYVILDEVRLTDANALEIKTIASFLNYKICHLKFKLSFSKYAFNNFHNHIEKYKSRSGKDFLFEQYAWLCIQYTTFADVFSEAIKNGLQSMQTQHPGVYYQKAAEFTQKRKESFQKTLAAMNPQMHEISSIQNLNITSLNTDYFGIRNFKNVELQNEQTMNLILIENEKKFDHSGLYINLLSQAMNQFKISRCLRFRKKITIDMADEYFKIGDINNALIFYTLMLLDYREDRWPALFLDVLLKTRNCARLSASINDYIACCIELLSAKIQYPLEGRVQALEDIWSILNRKVPALTNVGTLNDNSKLIFQWQEALNQLKSPMHVDLDKLTDIVEICATFEQDEVKSNDLICLNLILRSHMEIAVTINNLYVIIGDGLHQFLLQPDKFYAAEALTTLRHNSKYIITHPEDWQQMGSSVILKPSLFYIFLFCVEANHFMENSQLRVIRYELFMGTDLQQIQLTQTHRTVQNSFISHNYRANMICDNIVTKPICYITPTFHIVTQYIPCSYTMLVNEYYPVTLVVSNPYNIILGDVKINYTVPQQYRNKVFLAIDVSSNKQKLHSSIELEINELTTANDHRLTFLVYSIIADIIILEQKISYSMKVPAPISNQKLLIVTENLTTDSSENSPDGDTNNDIASVNLKNNQNTENNSTITNTSARDRRATTNMPTNIQLEYLDDNFIRKTQVHLHRIKCNTEFEFIARFYTLDKRPLTNVYRGENFLLRVNIKLKTDNETELEILETYFICDHNLTQNNYTRHRKKFNRLYRARDTFEDVYILHCHATCDEWQTAKEYEESKGDDRFHSKELFYRLESSRRHIQKRELASTLITQTPGMANITNNSVINSNNNSSKYVNSITFNANMNILSNNNNAVANNSTSNNANINRSISNNNNIINTKQNIMAVKNVISKIVATSTLNTNISTTVKANCTNTHIIYNKALDALQNTGHLRGFIRANIVTENMNSNLSQQQPQQSNTVTATAITSNYTIMNNNINSQQQPNNQHPFYSQQHIFGVYCIKWKRPNVCEENESKFAINGVPVLEPPLIIQCELEERMFVKMPITLKVLLKNPTHQILHLIASLNQFSMENFICSGHKEIDISIMAFGERELVYNLYPLYVGWQLLPELIIEYNTQADPSKDENQNNLLAELVERSMPKRIYVLPPLKQLPK